MILKVAPTVSEDTSLDSNNYYMDLLVEAGFIPVINNIQLPNFLVYFLPWENGELSFKEPLPSQAVRPWEFEKDTNSKLSLYYFSFLDCSLCTDNLREISELQLSKSTPANIEMLPIISGTNMTKIIVDFVKPHVEFGTKIFLDLEDGLVERMSVLHAPAFRFVDEKGLIFAYANNSLDLSSGGFRKLLKVLREWPTICTSRGYGSFSEVLSAKHPPLPQNGCQSFEKINGIHIVLIGILVVVCYSVLRRVKRR